MIKAFEDKVAIAQQLSVAPMHFAKAMQSGFEEREDGVLSCELVE